MARRVDRIDGLALIGSARIGPLATSVPALIDDAPAPPGHLQLEHREAPSGSRRLRLSDGAGAWELLVPILAPEVLGPPAGPIAIADGAWLVHAPVPAAGPDPAGPPPDLLVLGNAGALWNDGEAFVRALREVRDRWGAAPLLWAPRVALPHRVALLTYLGIDLVDPTEGLLRAAAGQYLDLAMGPADAAAVRAERACPCPACATDPPGPLADHTRATYSRAIAEARAAGRQGRLRELVESRLTSEPVLAEMLRYADRELAALLDERTPVTGDGTRTYVLAEAHRRPEMARFRRRLLERYRPPRSKSVLLLVPCSKTKPYRSSRSHRRFAGALEGLRAIERVHLVSVSSPIGVVPRELEDVPPARQYDIPVTGDWSEAERASVLAGVRHLLASGAYRRAVLHLDPVEYAFLGPALEGTPARWTIPDGRTTSAEALDALRSAVAEAIGEERAVPGGPLAVVREELGEIASVQFGRAAAERLCAPPLRLAGRPWFQRLTDGRRDLATVREERGLFFLTAAGAERVAAAPPLAIEVDPALPLTGDLFVPGVREADPEIRVGDSVILRRSGAVAAVGEAVLPGRLMTELGHGLAVKVRHRVGAATDTPKTEEDPPHDPGPVV